LEELSRWEDARDLYLDKIVDLSVELDRKDKNKNNTKKSNKNENNIDISHTITTTDMSLSITDTNNHSILKTIDDNIGSNKDAVSNSLNDALNDEYMTMSSSSQHIENSTTSIISQNNELCDTKNHYSNTYDNIKLTTDPNINRLIIQQELGLLRCMHALGKYLFISLFL
jgi:hypothetical protein